jgi:hypothetical protein
MKKIFSLPLVAALLISGVAFSSCGAGDANKKAQETADAFYKDLQNKQYDSALSLLSDKAFEGNSKEAWLKVFRRNTGLLGDLKSFSKTSGFNISTSTSSGTTVSVGYDVQWQYGKSTDSLFLVKEKDGSMKVYRYTWQHNGANYMTELLNSEKDATKYMDAIKGGDLGAAINMCSEEALKATPKDQWEAFLHKADAQYGQLTSFNIIKDSTAYDISTDGDAGKGNYYDVFMNSNRGDHKVMEKIVFFQKNYDEPIKLVGHYFL